MFWSDDNFVTIASAEKLSPTTRTNQRSTLMSLHQHWMLIGLYWGANESVANSDAQVWFLIRTSPASGWSRTFFLTLGSGTCSVDCLSNTRLPLSAVLTNSQQCRKWLFSFTCEGKRSFSTLLAVCHTADSSNLVFNKQNQQCICQQSWSRKWAKN